MVKRAIESDNDSEGESRQASQVSKRQRTEESDEKDNSPAPEASKRDAKGKGRADKLPEDGEDDDAEMDAARDVDEDEERRFEEEHEELIRNALMNKPKIQGVSGTNAFSLVNPRLMVFGFRGLRRWALSSLWKCTSSCVTSI